MEQRYSKGKPLLIYLLLPTILYLLRRFSLARSQAKSRLNISQKRAFVVARLNVGTPHTRLTIVVDILVTVALEALVVIASLALLLLLVSVLEASRLLQTKNESSFRPE